VLVAEDEAGALQEDRGDLSFTTSVENIETPLHTGHYLRSEGVPTVLISASMPMLPRAETNVIQRSVSLTSRTPYRYLKTPSQTLRRHSRSSHGVWVPINDTFLCSSEHISPLTISYARCYLSSTVYRLAALSTFHSQSLFCSWVSPYGVG